MSIPDKKIIVSLTSYPLRFYCLNQVIESILRQTKKADKIVLYLSEAEVSEKESALPADFQNLLKNGSVEVRWVQKSLKPHNKYFYAFQDFSDDLVVTIDDDIIYPQNLIETLYNSYLAHPDCVSAMRVHVVATDLKNGILPYGCWTMEDNSHIGEPSHRLFATGVGGVLYPVHLLDKSLLDENAIRETCLEADDLWLKFIELKSDVPVVINQNFSNLTWIPGSQEIGLCYRNCIDGQNDVQLKKICLWSEQKFGKDIFTEMILKSDAHWAENETFYQRINSLNLEVRALQAQLHARTDECQAAINAANSLNGELDLLRNQNLKNEKQIRDLHTSFTWRTGRLVTYVPRKTYRLLKKVRGKVREIQCIFGLNNSPVRFYLPYYKKDWIQSIIYKTKEFYENGILHEVLFNFENGIIARNMPDTVTLDIGANIGNHTLFFLSKCGAKKVYSFEPVKDTFRILRKNIKLNHYGKRAVLYNCGVGAAKGKASISLYDPNNIGSTQIQISETGGLKVISIDGLNISEKIGFIKIDCEGFEKAVIEGMLSTLRKNLPYILIEIRPENYEYIFKTLTDMNYTFKTIVKNDEYELCFCSIKA